MIESPIDLPSCSLQMVVVVDEQDAVAHRDAEERHEAHHAGDRDDRRDVALRPTARRVPSVLPISDGLSVR
jgi:hypothetical protein